jgi:hypothetical protein
MIVSTIINIQIGSTEKFRLTQEKIIYSFAIKDIAKSLK